MKEEDLNRCLKLATIATYEDQDIRIPGRYSGQSEQIKDMEIKCKKFYHTIIEILYQ
jgi:hypothetical protein